MGLHYQAVLRPLLEGRLIPFLGTGVNLAHREWDRRWEPGRILPSGMELAQHLAKVFHYQEGDPHDLPRISQYVVTMHGDGPLYDELHEIFNADYEPGPVHQFFACLPGVLREKGFPPSDLVILTNNFDDTLERAFDMAGQPFDVVSYISRGPNRGRCFHRPFGEEVRLIVAPNNYGGLQPDRRPVILKLCGSIDRNDPEGDSFVITEDDYIDFVSRTDVSSWLPVPIPARLKRGRFLFLGHSLRGWDVRVMLHQLLEDRSRAFIAWAVMQEHSMMDVSYWKSRYVDIINTKLNTYVDRLHWTLNGLRVREHGL